MFGFDVTCQVPTEKKKILGMSFQLSRNVLLLTCAWKRYCTPSHVCPSPYKHAPSPCEIAAYESWLEPIAQIFAHTRLSRRIVTFPRPRRWAGSLNLPRFHSLFWSLSFRSFWPPLPFWFDLELREFSEFFPDLRIFVTSVMTRQLQLLVLNCQSPILPGPSCTRELAGSLRWLARRSWAA